MLRTVAFFALMATLASSLDLEKIQSSSHFPHATQKHKRYPAATETLTPEAIYYRLLERKMSKLLPKLLRENDDSSSSQDYSEDEYFPEKRVPARRSDPGFDMDPDYNVPSASRYESDDGPSASTLYGIRKRASALRKHQQTAEKTDKRTTKRSRQPFQQSYGRNEAKKSSALSPGKPPYRSHRKLPSLERVPEAEKKSAFRSRDRQPSLSNSVQHSDKNSTSHSMTGKESIHSKRYAAIMKRSNSYRNRKDTRRAISQLRDIFGDDSDQKKRTIRKRENSSFTPFKSNGTIEDSTSTDDPKTELAPSEKPPEAKPTPEDNDYKFRKWLLDEYYRTMALSFASMRKKRMVPTEQGEPHKHSKRAPRAEEVDVDQFEAVENKLRNIEDAMIADALELVLEGAEGDSQLKAVSAGVANRLDAAYDLESVRQSLDHLHDTLESIHEERRDNDEEFLGAEDDDDSEDYEGRWSNFLEKKRGESVRKALQEMGPPVKRQNSDLEGSDESDDTIEVNENLPPTLRKYLQYAEAEESAEDECPQLQLLNGGCSALGGLFPPEPLRQRFLSACNWHEVCYTCGSVYGLSSDDCDDGFLQEMQRLCSQSRTCSSTMARMLISPLRRKRVFFKRSTSAVCTSDCVADFLKGR